MFHLTAKRSHSDQVAWQSLLRSRSLPSHNVRRVGKPRLVLRHEQFPCRCLPEPRNPLPTLPSCRRRFSRSSFSRGSPLFFRDEQPAPSSPPNGSKVPVEAWESKQL